MSIIIRLGNSYSEIIGSIPQDISSQISYTLSYVEKSDSYRRWVFKKRYGYFPPEKRQYLFKNQSFPTGLLSFVLDIMKVNNVDYKVDDARIRPTPHLESKWIYPYELRDYQKRAVEVLVRVGRGRLDVATGGGKGVIYMRLIHELNVRTLLVCATRPALNDMYKEAVNCFSSGYGRVGDGYKKEGELLTCITKSSFSKLSQETLNQYQCLIMDEHHESGGLEVYKQIMSMDCYHKYGGSGTQVRSDGRDILLQATTGRILYSIKAKDLQEKDMLCDAEIFMVDPNIHYITSRQFSDFHEQYEYCITKNEMRNNVALKIVEKHKEKQILVLCKSIEHGEILEDMLMPYGKVKWIDGKTKASIRNQVIDDFCNKKIDILIASTILDQSVNIVNLEVVIVLSAGKSPIKTIQRLGRALRKADGKEKAYVYFMYDTFNDKFFKQSQEVLKILKKENHTIKIIKEGEI